MDYQLHQNATLQATVTTVLGSLSLITGLIFIYFLGFLYTYSADLKAVLTVKNLLLFGLQLFQIGYFASHACYISFQISRPISVIEAVFLAGWESCFIWVSWTRSHDVFHVSSSPQAIKVFQVLVIITTVVTLIPPITILIDFNPEEGELAYIGSVLANGISIFILDTYFVFCYLMYLFQRTVETVELKGYEVDAVSIFRIIARYGLFASIATFACLCFVGGVASVSTDPNGDIYQYAIFIMLTDISCFLSTLCLVLMKMKLVRFRVCQKNKNIKK
ncbi:hypothetical protein BCR33DRAFT_713355 [Rhizoclosmatium globosum]|uniref:Uncharacterized protein n=1 Tax=Rhizoclosmatium globosum TaxID=329046 RepID=A0A1Y2CU50_9FUNG|nr:hypothetical protein BCR33DRAFT_713355 [Rhizoclosmatium globosum]|eukprot:ORY50590.1 hypothetical protein BCR33DRAFT_713355 [Rhizoclosmatium globosum]